MSRIPYQYFEVDPYEKPKELLDVNPRGLVPVCVSKYFLYPDQADNYYVLGS